MKNNKVIALTLTILVVFLSVGSCIAQSNEWHGPDFLIIGAQKGGTTSLSYYLSSHPQIVKSKIKEIHFFDIDTNFNKGIDWYKEQLNYSSKHDKKLYGEATPRYFSLLNPLTLERIHSLFPKTKFILLLRNPVDRAWSHYKMMLRKKKTKESFENFINADTDHVVSRGMYSTILKLWLNYFPKDQLLIIKSEDFFADQDTVTNQVFEFLGIKKHHLSSYDDYNSSEQVDGIIYPPLNPEMLAFLVDYFRPHNEELELLLGRKFNWN